MHFSAKLNLQKLNKMSLPRYSETVKLTSLPENRMIVIQKLRTVHTKKFGEHIIFDLPGNRCIFVPFDINKWLLEKPEEMDKMMKCVAEGKIGFERQGSTLQFSTLCQKGSKRKEVNQSDVETDVFEELEMEAEETDDLDE